MEVTVPVLLASVLLALLHYFESSYRPQFDEAQRKLETAADQIDGELRETVLTDDDSLMVELDDLRKEKFTRLPTWHKAALYVVLSLTAIVLFVESVLKLVSGAPEAPVFSLDLVRILYALAYGSISVVTVCAGYGTWRLAAKVRTYSARVAKLIEDAKPFHRIAEKVGKLGGGEPPSQQSAP